MRKTLALTAATLTMVALSSTPATAATTTYLSDLDPVYATSGWGPYERDRSNGEQGATDGRTITLNGATFTKGLGVHAWSDLRYTVPAGCTEFRSTVGVDDEVGSNGSVSFAVEVDFRKFYDSGTLTGTSASKSVVVPVQGGQELRLTTWDAGNGNGFDHADWADARLVCGDSEPPPPPPPSTSGVTIAAVGDAACDPGDSAFNNGEGTGSRCEQKAVGALIAGQKPSELIMLGDAQYEDATLAKFQASYDPAYGALKSITRPVLGNHEWQSGNANGHNAYWGNPAHYYAWDPAPGWRAYVLESTCHWNNSESCTPSSNQVNWLKSDLAANPRQCVVAAWHHPRWSAGNHGNQPNTGALYSALQDARAEVVLAGHDHNYQRFNRRLPSGAISTDGLRSFVIGTGGKNITGFPRTEPGTASQHLQHGALFMTLRDGAYDWRFMNVNGQTLDSGSGSCR